MRMMTRITLALAIALATVAFAQGAAIDCITDEPATITYIGDPVANLGETERATAAAFMEACPHITVEIIPGPASTSELLANYLVMFEGRSGDIDVLRVDVIHPGILADNLVDLKPYFSDEELAAHFPGYIENTMVGDRMVAIAFRLGAGMLYYRTDLLEKYGFAGPPATWDELESMAATIQAGERAAGNADFWGFVWQGDNYEGLTCNALEWQVSEGGGTVVNRELEPEVNNEAMLRAVERAAGWVGTISPPGVTGYREEDARAVWHVGNAAFMRNWPYAMASSATSEAIAGVWEVAPLPAGASGTYAATMGGWTLGVNRYSDERRRRGRLRQALRLLRGAEAPRRGERHQPDDRRRCTRTPTSSRPSRPSPASTRCSWAPRRAPRPRPAPSTTRCRRSTRPPCTPCSRASSTPTPP